MHWLTNYPYKNAEGDTDSLQFIMSHILRQGVENNEKDDLYR
jgi:hypothetical protein